MSKMNLGNTIDAGFDIFDEIIESETVISVNNNGSAGIAYALKKMQEVAAQSDPRTNEERERDIADIEAAQELGLDFWNKEEFADKSEIELDEDEEEKKIAVELNSLDDDQEQLIEFLEQLENYYDADYSERLKEQQAKEKKGVKVRKQAETGRMYVDRLLQETGIVLT